MNAPVLIHPERLAFFPPFLVGHGAFVCDQDLALTVRSASEISIAGLVGFRFLLDSGLHFADAVTEAPLAAARDVDDALAAPLVTAASG